jgi:hypothetical protein
MLREGKFRFEIKDIQWANSPWDKDAGTYREATEVKAGEFCAVEMYGIEIEWSKEEFDYDIPEDDPKPMEERKRYEHDGDRTYSDPNEMLQLQPRLEIGYGGMVTGGWKLFPDWEVATMKDGKPCLRCIWEVPEGTKFPAQARLRLIMCPVQEPHAGEGHPGYFRPIGDYDDHDGPRYNDGTGISGDDGTRKGITRQDKLPVSGEAANPGCCSIL